MTLSQSPIHANAQAESSSISVTMLLEQAYIYLAQEQYLEGMALMMIVKSSILPEQQELTQMLEPMIREFENFRELQQQSLSINSQIAEAQKQLQTRITTLQHIQNTFSKELLQVDVSTAQNQVMLSPIQLEEPSKESNSFPNTQLSPWYAICLAPFELRRNNTRIDLCVNRNGQAILRYLINQDNYSATTDVLMTLLWPNDAPDVALNKLYVAVSLLRRSLQQSAQDTNKYIIYRQGMYQIDPSLSVRTDIDNLLDLHHAGRREQGTKAIDYYEQACSLYKRPFLLEDIYASWSFQRREYLRQIYIMMCHELVLYHVDNKGYEKGTYWANRILEENRCDEEAHQHLIRIYALRGRRHDALRQFQLCQQILQEEMNVDPMPDTVNLFKSVMRGDLL